MGSPGARLLKPIFIKGMSENKSQSICLQVVPIVSEGTSVSLYLEKVILPITNNLNISTKFKITLKWKHFQVKKWIDTTGEIQILYIILKWFLMICFHVIGVVF